MQRAHPQSTQRRANTNATPTQHRIPSLHSASGTLDQVKQLQRAYGNRAMGQWLGRVAQQKPLTSNAVIQRVGEKKFGYQTHSSADNKEDVDLFLQLIEQVKSERKDKKNTFETNELAKMSTKALAEKQKTLFEDYKPILEHNTYEPLKQKAEALGWSLLTDKETVTVKNDKEQVIATLTFSKEAYEPMAVKDGEHRAPFAKKGSLAKHYVRDNKGVQTRRIAYVEKNYFQFLEFLSTHQMEGRYQYLHRAVGKVPDIKQPGTESTDKVIHTRPATLNEDQVAVIHQWFGSGLQQRGLSLTSTPRKGAVYGNEGVSFRTPDGVRIAIDLSKVPQEILLLNHYGEGGVKDRMDNPENDFTNAVKGEQYSYKESVLKNRELYLEHLKPEWIMEVEYHGTGKTFKMSDFQKAAEMLQQVGEDMGQADYHQGFQAAVTGKPAGIGASATYGKGHGSGMEYMAGYKTGKKHRQQEKITTNSVDFNELAKEYQKNDKKTEDIKAKIKELADVYRNPEKVQKFREKYEDLVGVPEQYEAALHKLTNEDFNIANPRKAISTLLEVASDLANVKTLARTYFTPPKEKGEVVDDPKSKLANQAMNLLTNESKDISNKVKDAQSIGFYDVFWIGWGHGVSGLKPVEAMNNSFYNGKGRG